MEFNDVRLQLELLRSEIDGAISAVLTSGRYILGPSLEKFEEEFAGYCRAAEGVGVASGMDAIAIALRASGTGPAAPRESRR